MIQHPLICWKLYYLFESLLTSLASPFSDWPTMALVYWALPGFHWYLWPSPFLPAPSTNWLLLQATLNMFIVLPICPHAPLFFCCAMWAFGILVPQPGVEPTSPAAGAQSFHHRTTREVPRTVGFFFLWFTKLRLIISQTWMDMIL